MDNFQPGLGRQPRRAFTLVELLVVVGIVAVLCGILLPALGTAREAGRGVLCMSNLRQMGAAAIAYVGESQGAFPIAQYRARVGPVRYSYAWDLTTIQETGQPTRVVPGLLWKGRTGGGDGTERVQQCPSFDGGANWLTDPYTGYNYNTSYIGHGEGETVEAPAKVSAVRRPGETALFGDGQYSGGANKFMRSPLPHPGDAFGFRYAGTQGYRHRGRTNVAFCDGHAEGVGDRFTANPGGAENVGAGTGFLSADNAMYDLE
jgi:prepilin-type processing-associated H-X9-DG protein/prepilin-type N-terminal cleavage/methylation domain-containing protein